ncbi:pyridoxal-phosphate dependent enzyme [Klebsiella pneumoniae subsp. pneumoniae]|nr:pyridoxal-phosphate dependent enzyme [Klebsiella pneumoniae subsp. pneumoniae]
MPRSNYFSERCRGEIFLKFENMQRTGSFKIRGAFNKLCGLTAAEKRKGVVACSAGNHAQGRLALLRHARHRRESGDAGKGRRNRKLPPPRDYSAEVVLHGDNFNDTLAKASDIVELEGRIFIPPMTTRRLSPGRGRLDSEILEDLYDVDNVIVPIGGGGLIAGIAIAIKSINPTIRIIGVQSENVHGMAASWYAGEITSHRHAGTLADGLRRRPPGETDL